MSGASEVPQTPVELLRAARERIADPERWCREALKKGDGRCCSRGAVYEMAGVFDVELISPGLWPAEDTLHAAATEILGGDDPDHFGPVVLNDEHPEGHLAVMAMFDLAIEIAEAA